VRNKRKQEEDETKMKERGERRRSRWGAVAAKEVQQEGLEERRWRNVKK
jgi:hypothetical protein